MKALVAPAPPPPNEDLEETAGELRLRTGPRAAWSELRAVGQRVQTDSSSVDDAQCFKCPCVVVNALGAQVFG